MELLNGSSWLGLLGSVGLMLAGHLANKYVIPFLQVGKRKHYAEYIAVLADDITDDLKGKYPEREWLKHLDEAIDTLIAVCGISTEIASRAISAAASRK